MRDGRPCLTHQNKKALFRGLNLPFKAGFFSEDKLYSRTSFPPVWPLKNVYLNIQPMNGRLTNQLKTPRAMKPKMKKTIAKTT